MKNGEDVVVCRECRIAAIKGRHEAWKASRATRRAKV